MLKTMTFRLRFVLAAGAGDQRSPALVTDIISAWLPARKAAAAGAIASVRGQNDVAVKLGRSHRLSERIVAKWFGPEGLLAQKIARSRQTFRTTVAALAVAVVLLRFIGFLWHQAGVFNAMMTERTTTPSPLITRAPRRAKPAITPSPIASSLGDEITAELDGGTEIYGLGNDCALRRQRGYLDAFAGDRRLL